MKGMKAVRNAMTRSSTKKVGFDRTGDKKMKLLRKCPEAECERLKDAVYEERGWNKRIASTLEKAKAVRIDYRDVIELLQKQWWSVRSSSALEI
jgi:hypothetical protein